MPTICEQCGTDLDEVMEEVAGEDLEDRLAAISDCTLHDPAFDPTNYKTWPSGYMGTLIDRYHDMRKDGLV